MKKTHLKIGDQLKLTTNIYISIANPEDEYLIDEEELTEILKDIAYLLIKTLYKLRK